MIASVETFLASEAAQLGGVIVAGLIVAGLIGWLLTLILSVDDRVNGLGHWVLELDNRADENEEGMRSLNQRVAVLEADLHRRQQKAAEFKLRMEAKKSAKKA